MAVFRMPMLPITYGRGSNLPADSGSWLFLATTASAQQVDFTEYDPAKGC